MLNEAPNWEPLINDSKVKNKQTKSNWGQTKERKKETIDWHILQEAGRKDVEQRRKNNSMNEGRSVTKVN